MHSFLPQVTSICCVKQRIVVSGWSQYIAYFQDTRDIESTPPKAVGQGVHSDDILCMAHQESGLIASGSYDGDVVVWNIDMERCVLIDEEHST